MKVHNISPDKVSGIRISYTHATYLVQ